MQITTTKPAPFAERARELHAKASQVLQSIIIKQELLVEFLEEGNEKSAEMCSRSIDNLAAKYADIMQALIQPAIDKTLQICTD